MKIYVTIKIDYFNDPNGPRYEKYELDRKWDENTHLGNYFKSDFDWCHYGDNKNYFYGRNIYDRAITVSVKVEYDKKGGEC